MWDNFVAILIWLESPRSHLNPEFGALCGVARGKPPRHILLDDDLRHVETDADPLVRPPGGEVGIENLLQDLFGDAARVVGDGDDAPPPLAEYLDGNHPRPVVLACQEGVPGVEQDVEYG